MALLTGDPTSQVVGNATEVIDLGQTGFLGVGSLNGLADGQGVLSLRYTQLDSVTPSEMGRAAWGGNTGLFMVVGQSMAWDGSDRFASDAWSTNADPTPGEV